MIRRWRKRREWRRQVNNAIRLGRLGQFHQERFGFRNQTDRSSECLPAPVRH